VGPRYVNEVDGDTMCGRLTFVVHIEKLVQRCRGCDLVNPEVLRSRCCATCLWWDARCGMMRGGEDGAVELSCRYQPWKIGARSHVKASRQVSYHDYHVQNTRSSCNRSSVSLYGFHSL
jgi:hypothetical protein